MSHFPDVVAELKECNRLMKENNELLRFLVERADLFGPVIADEVARVRGGRWPQREVES